jgi:hypothetical protein
MSYVNEWVTLALPSGQLSRGSSAARHLFTVCRAQRSRHVDSDVNIHSHKSPRYFNILWIDQKVGGVTSSEPAIATAPSALPRRFRYVKVSIVG